MLWMVSTKKIGTHTRRKSDCSLSVWNTQTYIPTEYLQLWKASHYTVSVLCLERFKFREVSTAYFCISLFFSPKKQTLSPTTIKKEHRFSTGILLCFTYLPTQRNSSRLQNEKTKKDRAMVFLRPIRSIIHSVTNTPVEGDKLTVGN